MFRSCSALVIMVALVLTSTAWAHEIPNEVLARMLAKAEGETFQLVVRIPLSSMRDVEVPEFGPGYLNVEELAPRLGDLATQWIVPFVEIYEDDERLPVPRLAATQISLPSDDSLTSFERALTHIAAPRPANTENLIWDQVLFDVLLEYPIRSEHSEFSIRPGLDHLAAQVATTLRFQLPNDVIRAYQFAGDPGRVPLDPSWFQAAWRFVQLGFLHILDGPDHLLFLFCLVVPLRRLRTLALIVTAFTISHSITLIASAFGLAPGASWFPPLVETLIAVSILYMALENIIGATHLRWLIALGFGLVHGFGFSFALRETLQFAGSHLVTSLLSFNVGVELGQLFVLMLLVPALAGLFRYVVAERIGTIIVSAFAAHEAWHWTLERAAVLNRFNASWSGSPVTFWLLAGLALLGGTGLAAAYRNQRTKHSPHGTDTPAEVKD